MGGLGQATLWCSHSSRFYWSVLLWTEASSQTLLPSQDSLQLMPHKLEGHSSKKQGLLYWGLSWCMYSAVVTLRLWDQIIWICILALTFVSSITSLFYIWIFICKLGMTIILHRIVLGIKRTNTCKVLYPWYSGNVGKRNYNNKHRHIRTEYPAFLFWIFILARNVLFYAIA